MWFILNFDPFLLVYLFLISCGVKKLVPVELTRLDKSVKMNLPVQVRTKEKIRKDDKAGLW